MIYRLAAGTFPHLYCIRPKESFDLYSKYYQLLDNHALRKVVQKQINFHIDSQERVVPFTEHFQVEGYTQS